MVGCFASVWAIALLVPVLGANTAVKCAQQHCTSAFVECGVACAKAWGCLHTSPTACSSFLETEHPLRQCLESNECYTDDNTVSSFAEVEESTSTSATNRLREELSQLREDKTTKKQKAGDLMAKIMKDRLHNKNAMTSSSMLQEESLDTTLGCKVNCKQSKHWRQLDATQGQMWKQLEGPVKEKVELVNDDYMNINGEYDTVISNIKAMMGGEKDSWSMAVKEIQGEINAAWSQSQTMSSSLNEKLDNKDKKELDKAFKDQINNYKSLGKSAEEGKEEIFPKMEDDGEALGEKITEVSNQLKEQRKRMRSKTNSVNGAVEKQIQEDSDATMDKIKDVGTLVKESTRDIKMKLDQGVERAATVAETQAGLLESIEEIVKGAEDSFEELEGKAEGKYEEEDAKLEETSSNQQGELEKNQNELDSNIEKLAEVSEATFATAEKEQGKATGDWETKTLDGQQTVAMKTWGDNVEGWKNGFKTSRSKLEAATVDLYTQLADKDAKLVGFDGEVLATQATTSDKINSDKVLWSQAAATKAEAMPAEFSDVNDGILATQSEYYDKLINDKASLTGNLAAIYTDFDLKLKGVKAQITAFNTRNDNEFLATTQWQDHLVEMLRGQSFTTDEWNKDSVTGLTDLAGSLKEDMRVNVNKEKVYENLIQKSIQTSKDDLETRISDAMKEHEQTITAGNRNLATEKASALGRIKMTSEAMGAELMALQEQIQKSDADKSAALKANRDLLNQLISTRLPGLLKKSGKNAQVIAQSIKGLKATGDGLAQAFEDQLRAGFIHVADQIAAELATDATTQDEKVAAIKMDQEKKVAAKTERLSSAEKKQERFAADFGRSARSVDNAMNKVDSTVQKTEKAGTGIFNQAIALLSEDKLALCNNEDALKAAVEKETLALGSGMKAYAVKIGDRSMGRFKRKLATREDDIKKVMDNAAMSFNQKQHAIKEHDKKLAKALAGLQEELEETGKLMHQEADEEDIMRMKLHSKMEAIHNEVSSDTLLALGDEEMQRRALEKRAAMVKDAITSGEHKLGADVLAHIDELQAKANRDIMDILNNENITDEQKRHAIEKIEATSRQAIADAAANQVFAESRVVSYAEKNNKLNRELDAKMAGMDSVLKDEQHAWLRGTLKQKVEMRDQANGLVSVLDGLIKMIKEDEVGEDGQLSERRRHQLKLLSGLRGDLAELAIEREAAAKEALAIAELAEAKSKAVGEISDEEMAALEARLNGMNKDAHETDANMWERLENAKAGRSDAMQHEKSFMAGSMYHVLQSIEDITHIVKGAIHHTGARGEALEQKVTQLREMLRREIAHAAANGKSKLDGVEGREGHIESDQNALIDSEAAKAKALMGDEHDKQHEIDQLSDDMEASMKMQNDAFALTEQQTNRHADKATAAVQNSAKADAADGQHIEKKIVDGEAKWISQTEGNNAKSMKIVGKDAADLEDKEAKKISELNADDDKMVAKSKEIKARMETAKAELVKLDVAVENALDKQMEDEQARQDQEKKEIGHVAARAVSAGSLVEDSSHGLESKINDLEVSLVQQRAEDAKLDAHNEQVRQKLNALKSMSEARRVQN